MNSKVVQVCSNPDIWTCQGESDIMVSPKTPSKENNTHYKWLGSIGYDGECYAILNCIGYDFNSDLDETIEVFKAQGESFNEIYEKVNPDKAEEICKLFFEKIYEKVPHCLLHDMYD